jgi:hypothetical protein
MDAGVGCDAGGENPEPSRAATTTNLTTRPVEILGLIDASKDHHIVLQGQVQHASTENSHTHTHLRSPPYYAF